MIKNKGLIKNNLIKNILIVFSGNAVGILIPFLGSFWIARLYKPEDLGYFSFLLVVINIIVLVSDLKLGERLIIEEKQEEKIKILNESVLIILIITILTSPFLIFFFYGKLGLFTFFLPLLLIILSFSNLLINYSISTKEFKLNSNFKVVMNAFDFTFQVLFSKLKIVGLSISKFLSSLIALIYLFKYLKIRHNKKFYLSFEILKKNRKYVLSYVPNIIVNHLSLNVINYSFPLSYGLNQSGLYSFISRIMFGPISVITSSLQQVFYKELADKINKNERVHGFFIKFYTTLISVMLIPMFLICVYSKEIILYLFGENWVGANIYIIALAPFFIINSCNSSFSSIFILKGKIITMTKLECFYLISKTVVIFSCYWLDFNVTFMANSLGILLFLTSITTSIFYYRILSSF
jgi:lipopolysaccharide exporter